MTSVLMTASGGSLWKLVASGGRVHVRVHTGGEKSKNLAFVRPVGASLLFALK